MFIIGRCAVSAVKIISFVFAGLFLLCGCGRGGSTELRWQSYPLTVKCGISCDDRGAACENAELIVEVTAPYMGEITFLSPDSLCGYTLSLKAEGASVSYDGITVPLGEDIATDLEAFFSLFSLDPAYMSDHSVNKQNGTTVNIAVFSLYLRENSEADDNLRGSSKKQAGDESIGEATVYISAAGDPIRIEAEYGDGERIVINVRECEYGEV